LFGFNSPITGAVTETLTSLVAVPPRASSQFAMGLDQFRFMRSSICPCRAASVTLAPQVSGIWPKPPIEGARSKFFVPSVIGSSRHRLMPRGLASVAGSLNASQLSFRITNLEFRKWNVFTIDIGNEMVINGPSYNLWGWEMKRVCIVGGGPAGLGVANMLRKSGIDFQLFDSGPPLDVRHHDCADHLGCGIGGAGLFSDGKFSFFPSGTHLYQLSNSSRLRAAYAETANVLRDAGIESPEFPVQSFDCVNSDDGIVHKAYASKYATLAQRRKLTMTLAGQHQTDRVKPMSRVEGIKRALGGYVVTFRDLTCGRTKSVEFTDVVFATGRFGGLSFKRLCRSPSLVTEQQRYELGIRIEHPNGIGFLSKFKNNDVKLFMSTSDVQVRTFCTCRRGEVWHIPYETVSALSGRSDGPPTEYSNFGLLPRFTGEQEHSGREIWGHFIRTFRKARTAFWQPLRGFVDGALSHHVETETINRPWQPRKQFAPGEIDKMIHPELNRILRDSIRTLINQYPDIDCSEAVCLFPAIEGIGCFPSTNEELRTHNWGVWCCGDVVGKFRGLVPALVSGHYVGLAIESDQSSALHDNRELEHESH
jgi:uncharacterized protein